MKLFAFVLKNLRRSPLRTFLTSIALVVLVVLFSVIWSILAFLQEAMAQKAADIPVVITERYRIPSRFDRAFMEEIVRPGTRTNTALSEIQGFHSEKHNVWHFVVFSLDKDLKDKDQQFFVIATIPEKIKSMIESMESLDADAWKPMINPPKSRLEHIGILMGPDHRGIHCDHPLRVLQVAATLQPAQHPGPGAVSGPPPMPVVHRLPMPVSSLSPLASPI